MYLVLQILSCIRSAVELCQINIDNGRHAEDPHLASTDRNDSSPLPDCIVTL